MRLKPLDKNLVGVRLNFAEEAIYSFATGAVSDESEFLSGQDFFQFAAITMFHFIPLVFVFL